MQKHKLQAIVFSVIFFAVFLIGCAGGGGHHNVDPLAVVIEFVGEYDGRLEIEFSNIEVEVLAEATGANASPVIEFKAYGESEFSENQPTQVGRHSVRAFMDGGDYTGEHIIPFVIVRNTTAEIFAEDAVRNTTQIRYFNALEGLNTTAVLRSDYDNFSTSVSFLRDGVRVYDVNYLRPGSYTMEFLAESLTHFVTTTSTLTIVPCTENANAGVAFGGCWGES